jgi:hypothetical protein
VIDVRKLEPQLVSAKPEIPPLRQPGDIIQVRHEQDELPDPTIQWLGGHKYKLIGEDCRIPDFRRKRHHIVRKGFVFDAASVPRIAWPFISPVDLGVLAVLSHDDLYDRGGMGVYATTGGAKMFVQYSRYEADVLFYDLMTLEGVGLVRRRAAYQAVRKFGGISAWQG